MMPINEKATAETDFPVSADKNETSHKITEDFSDESIYTDSPITEKVILTERKNGFRMGTDSVLLSKFATTLPTDKGVDLGTGSGVIPLLLLSENKCAHIQGIEVQETLHSLALYNAQKNNVSDRFFPILGDIRNISALYPRESADFVTLNPPYFKAGTGKQSVLEEKLIARHEMNGVISDFCVAAAYCLKFGGKFFAVFRADRLMELLYAMKQNGIEPKHIELIHKNEKAETVLIKGIKGAKEGLTVTVTPTKPIQSF